MAAINDLINQIDNPDLRARIQQEVDRMNKQKKFGLVFEEHLPECTPLYDVPVRKGSRVALKNGKVNETYVVLKQKDNIAVCLPKGGGEPTELPVADLVSVAEFGKTIYPYLKPIDSVCNAPDSDLWHTLIEADNYHALQLLEYLYAGKVDCIYIDPPYNTGAKDWKYNNDYVDNVDTYRHSKWLSMMQKRLKIAKKLLNPQNSVLIITIDEKEYLHLGCLLEEMFPEAKIQMISTVINHASIARVNEFNRNNEYIFFIMLGSCYIAPLAESKNFLAGDPVHWETLRRHNAKNVRSTLPNQFYPIYVNNNTHMIEKIGEPYKIDGNVEDVQQIEDCTAVFPIRDDGTEMVWGCRPEELTIRLKNGYVRAASYSPRKPQKYSIQYLTSGTISDIENGKITINGHKADGSIIACYDTTRAVLPKTQWDIPSHDARDFGTKIVKKIFTTSRFTFPKSLYAVHDALQYFVTTKPNAIIVDFFAGSGTTLHAVNLLNAEDGGHRRCIMVTNNEVSDDEAKTLTAQGYHPGDDEWEKLGICRYVTWPRTVCSIEGHDVNGKPLEGNYLGSEIPMADGFKANAVYFKLSFLNKTDVALGRQFKEMLPTLWMKAGAHGPCPTLKGKGIPSMLVLPENRLAVLTEESAFTEFEATVNIHPEIETIYIVTDYEVGYRAMAKSLSAPNTYQLYRDYLDNFRINIGRD